MRSQLLVAHEKLGTVAAADGASYARERWEINFLLTFETAPFFCVTYTLYILPVLQACVTCLTVEYSKQNTATIIPANLSFTSPSGTQLSSTRPTTRRYRLLIQNGRSCCHPHTYFGVTVFASSSFSYRGVNLNDVIRETCLISPLCASSMLGQ
jgi:hypothetical protein